ncbi:MAG TPA: trypsin-like peptidase domain-containing protein [Steroidobacteraceae bacterium]
MSALRRQALLLPALVLVAATAGAQSPGEAAFRAAADWTVQIRTSVSRPFIEDEQGSWLGAGLLVDAERGWILTNAHVAGRSYGKIMLAFRDGRALPAQRLYVDPYVDLAVISFQPTSAQRQIRTPTLNCGALPPVGHPVGAFGHPWGFRFTATRGITSAVSTRLGTTMLQTDAPINEGNSGGPLISLETGQVVGINAAKIKEESVEGLSFAVPMSYGCTILDRLRQGRDPSPPMRLVDFAHDEDDEQTMVVARSRLPAGSLDLRSGDEILGLGTSTQAITTESDLMDALRGELGAISLKVRRDGRDVEIKGRWPAAPSVTAREGLWMSGALVAEAEPLTAGQIAEHPALMVHHVESGSEAEAAGLQDYDLVLSADGAPVDSLPLLLERAQRARSAGRPLALMLLRIGSDMTDEFFRHEQRQLPIEDLEHIGPPH